MPGITNTGGTLALHIAGNLRHFLGNTLGGVAYARDRDAEFANRTATRAEIAGLLDETRKAIEATVTTLSPEALAKPFPLQIVGRTVSTADFVMHLASHLSYHLGQLDYHRRVVTGEPLVVPAVEVKKIPEMSPIQKRSPDYPYVTHMDIRFKPLELIDVQKVVDEVTDPWFNQTLCAVNESVVRLGVVKGEYHWHQHNDLDEFFYVVEGRFFIELEGRTVELGPRQGLVVPKGVQHRPRAPERTVILMVEGAGIVPTGD